MTDKTKTIVKVAKFRIHKPTGEMTWQELGKLLDNTRYRVYRLANLAVSEAYLNFHLWRTGKSEQYQTRKIGELSQQLRKMFQQENHDEEEMNRFSKKGILPDYVVSALYQYKIRAITNPAKWREVIRGKASLPTFRNNIAIPVRCDKDEQRRLEKADSGEVELDLMICTKPYPRIVLKTHKLDSGQTAILERLLDNKENVKGEYRQRLFEIKQDQRTHQWYLLVTYEFQQQINSGLKPDVIVGVDLGYSVPLYAAINNGHARLGRRHFQSLANKIKGLRNQTVARRRSILRAGKQSLTKVTSGSGHGRKRKIVSIEKLQNRIDNAYKTFNHQLSSTVIDFAIDNSAGKIQIEDLSGLKEQLMGTFLGASWRYYQLQQFLEYKAEEAGIAIEKINPFYTSRRCSECGYINIEFDRRFRDKNKQSGKPTQFVCPECKYEEDPDYNAARNIATIDIADKIKLQCNEQGIEYKAL